MGLPRKDRGSESANPATLNLRVQFRPLHDLFELDTLIPLLSILSSILSAGLLGSLAGILELFRPIIEGAKNNS